MDRKRVIERDKQRIASQPVYGTREEAIKIALERANARTDYPEVWKDPRNGEYIVASTEALEALGRHGYKREVSIGQLADMRATDEIEEV